MTNKKEAQEWRKEQAEFARRLFIGRSAGIFLVRAHPELEKEYDGYLEQLDKEFSA